MSPSILPSEIWSGPSTSKAGIRYVVLAMLITLATANSTSDTISGSSGRQSIRTAVHTSTIVFRLVRQKVNEPPMPLRVAAIDTVSLLNSATGCELTKGWKGRVDPLSYFGCRPTPVFSAPARWGGAIDSATLAGCNIKIRLKKHQKPTILTPKYRKSSVEVPSAPRPTPPGLRLLGLLLLSDNSHPALQLVIRSRSANGRLVLSVSLLHL